MPEPCSLTTYLDLTETIAPQRRIALLQALCEHLAVARETTRYTLNTAIPKESIEKEVKQDGNP